MAKAAKKAAKLSKAERKELLDKLVGLHFPGWSSSRSQAFRESLQLQPDEKLQGMYASWLEEEARKQRAKEARA